MQNSKRLCNE